MILVLVFAVGVLVEDVSKNSVAERSSIAAIFNHLADSDKQLRLKSLFEVGSYSDDHMDVKPNALYKDLMNISNSVTETNQKDTRFAKHKTIIETIIPSSSLDENKFIRISGPQIVTLQDEVNGIYYAAHNRVYQESSYFSELQGIASRIDFARSLTFLCLTYSVCYLILGILCYLPQKLNLFHEARAKRKLIVLMCAIYVIGIFLAGISYRSETTNYNLRVFGYYISTISPSVDSIKK